jgi:F0F1-type ATP synthase epsilon subunit
MRLLIQTAEKLVLDRDGLSHIRLPMADGGSIGIRKGHHRLIGEMARGKIIYHENDLEEEMAVGAGLVQVENDLVTVFASGSLDETEPENSTGKSLPLERLMASLLEGNGKPG